MAKSGSVIMVSLDISLIKKMMVVIAQTINEEHANIQKVIEKH
jgi:hypothetical protein